MWKSGKRDPEIEELLSRYRPAGPKSDRWDQIPTFPNSQISKSPKAWPWAVAAAALLAISLGLHGAVASAPDPSAVVDAQRVQAIADELGGTPEIRVMAEWLARREAMAEQERLARAAGAEGQRQ